MSKNPFYIPCAVIWALSYLLHMATFDASGDEYILIITSLVCVVIYAVLYLMEKLDEPVSTRQRFV